MTDPDYINQVYRALISHGYGITIQEVAEYLAEPGTVNELPQMFTTGKKEDSDE
jgi:hypothetical protein